MGGIYFRGKDKGFEISSGDKKKNNRKQQYTNSGPVLRALIADDDPFCAQLLHIVMVNYGFETTMAFDGKDALDIMSRRQFDLVFLDMSMPQLSGLEVLAEMGKVNKDAEKSTPIVTYTALDHDKLALPEENGFHIVGHWQKPITLSELATLTGKTVNQLGLK